VRAQAGVVDQQRDAGVLAQLGLDAGPAGGINNLDAWLTTVVARICLNNRHGQGREELVERLPDPIVDPVGEFDPEHRAMLADAVGLALFVVLNTLPPAERLALVLHDVFAVPFEQIASILERSPEAARKLASRARRRIERADAVPDRDIAAQRRLVDAFFAAGRSGDFDRLVSLLDPGVVLRGDLGPGAVRSAHGASAVAALARSHAAPEREVRPATVNGAAGAVVFIAGRPAAVMGFLVRNARGAAIDVLAEEPPVQGNPLLAADIPNLLVTPHIAWAAREARQRALEQVAENLRSWLDGGQLRRVV